MAILRIFSTVTPLVSVFNTGAIPTAILLKIPTLSTSRIAIVCRLESPSISDCADYFGLIQEKHGGFSNIDPATGGTITVGQGRLYQPDYNNVAPRVSVAWDVTGHQRTVLRAGFGIFYDAYSRDMFEGHLPFNSFYDPGPAYNGLSGPPITFRSTFGGVLDPSLPVYGGTSPLPDAFGVDQNMRTPYMENYNLNLQQQLGRKMTLQVGYVGSQGHKLLRFRDINQPTQAEITAADCAGQPLPAPGQPCPGGTIQDGTVPRHLTGASLFPYYINYMETSSNSIYNSLQTSLHIDNWHGLTTTVSYTWSHSLDDASDGEDYVPNASQPNDSQVPIKFNRGNSNFDVRQRLARNFIYNFQTTRVSI